MLLVTNISTKYEPYIKLFLSTIYNPRYVIVCCLLSIYVTKNQIYSEVILTTIE